MAALEFGLPRGVWRPLWELYVRVGLPVAGRVISPGLARGRVVPRAEHPRPPRPAADLRADRALARGRDRGRARAAAQPRRRLRHLGASRVSDEPAGLLRARAGRLARLRDAAAPAVHAVAPLVRRDRSRARARTSRSDRLLVALAAFFLAVGIGAHALDELNGHPLQTRISDRTLVGLSAVSIGGAVVLGIYGSIAYTPWLAPLVAVGAFIVVRLQPRALRRRVPLRCLVRASPGGRSRCSSATSRWPSGSRSEQCSRPRSPAS